VRRLLQLGGFTMQNPSITINGVKYTAKSPKMRHWLLVNKFKTERRERAEELKALLKSGEKIADEQQAEKVFNEIEQKAEANKRLNIEMKVGILSEIFDAEFDDVEITVIHEAYAEIEAWINVLVSGAISRIPNGETQSE
jgi:hypothetical protein